MEILNKVWNAVSPYLAGVSVSGIIAAVIYGCLKGSFNKTIDRTVGQIDVSKIAKKTGDEVSAEMLPQLLNKIQNVSFTQTIQPIVESELKKVTETANEYIKKALEKTDKRYAQLVSVMEALAHYFDNSIGVPDEAKQRLKAAIELAKDAQNAPESVEFTIIEECVEDEKEIKSTRRKDVEDTVYTNDVPAITVER